MLLQITCTDSSKNTASALWWATEELLLIVQLKEVYDEFARNQLHSCRPQTTMLEERHSPGIDAVELTRRRQP